MGKCEESQLGQPEGDRSGRCENFGWDMEACSGANLPVDPRIILAQFESQ